jgi:hypothetical protein
MAVRQGDLEEVLFTFLFVFVVVQGASSPCSYCFLEAFLLIVDEGLVTLDSQLQRHLRCNGRLCISCSAISAPMADWA